MPKPTVVLIGMKFLDKGAPMLGQTQDWNIIHKLPDVLHILSENTQGFLPVVGIPLGPFD